MISHGSWGQRDKGSHASTLELWQGNDGGLSIEWDIPGLEQTEHVGLTFDADKRLVDYDGIMALPEPIAEWLRELGYVVEPPY